MKRWSSLQISRGGGEGWQALQALLGLLQEGVVRAAGQGPVLLGIAGPGEGPEAGAGAAAEDHRDQGSRCHGCRGCVMQTCGGYST